MRPLSMREAPPRPGGTGGPSSGSGNTIGVSIGLSLAMHATPRNIGLMEIRL